MLDRPTDLTNLCVGLRLQRPEGRFRGALALVAAACHTGLAADLDAFLSPQESGSFRALAFERRQRSYLMGRYAAKRAAGALLGEPDGRRLAVMPGIFGQPVLSDPDGRGLGIGVSISHADEIACAVAFPEAHPMGIDVETVAADSVPVIAGVLTAAERVPEPDLFPGPGGESIRHAVLWTAKEALSKTLRCGHMTPFELFETEALALDTGPRFPVALFQGGQWDGRYRNFGQYKFQSWAGDRAVLTLALPRRTDLRVEM